MVADGSWKYIVHLLLFLFFQTKKRALRFAKTLYVSLSFVYSVLSLGFFSVIPSFDRLKNTVAKMSGRRWRDLIHYSYVLGQSQISTLGAISYIHFNVGQESHLLTPRYFISLPSYSFYLHSFPFSSISFHSIYFHFNSIHFSFFLRNNVIFTELTRKLPWNIGILGGMT